MAGKRKLKLWHVAVSLPVICGLGGLGFSIFAARSAQAEIDRERRALDALGIPTTPEGMRQRVDAAQNAAPIYRNAIAAFRRHGRTQPTLQRRSDGTFDPIELENRRKWVVEHTETLNLIEQAAQKEKCDYGRDWAKGVYLLLPEFADMKTFVKLATFRARMEAEAGRFDRSFHWLDVGRRVSVHAREPILIGQLVAIAGEAIVHAEVQDQTRLYGSNSEFRKFAREFLSKEGDLPSLRDAMKGECMFVHLTMEQLRNGTVKLDDLSALSSGGGGGSSTTSFVDRMRLLAFKMPGVQQRAEATLLHEYRIAIETMGRNPNDTDRVLKASRELDRAMTLQDDTLSGKLAGIFAPVFAQAGTAFVRALVGRVISRCGVELYEIKAQTGAFPPALDATKPWAIDPFSKKPFVYRREKGGFVLYSVGPNGVDDGGRPFVISYSPGTPMTSSRTTDDIEFRAPRPR